MAYGSITREWTARFAVGQASGSADEKRGGRCTCHPPTFKERFGLRYRLDLIHARRRLIALRAFHSDDRRITSLINNPLKSVI